MLPVADPPVVEPKQRRLWLPLLLLVAAVALLLQVETIAGWLALPPSRARLLEQLATTAAWLAATFTGITVLNLMLNAAALRRTGRSLPRLVTDLLAFVIWLTAGIGVAAVVFGQPVGGLIATSGVAIAVVGFAMRDTIASLVAAIALNVEAPYHRDDWISLEDGTAARIEEIGWFTTRALTRDRVRVILPNSALASRVHKNFGSAGWFWRDDVYLRLDPTVSPARVRAVLGAALLDVEALRHRPPGRRADVVLHEITLEGANWRLRYWLDDYARAIELKDQVLRTVLRHLHHAGLQFARPVREIVEAERRDVGGHDHRPLVEHLARTELFGGLAPGELATLAGNAREHRLGQAATVIEAGAPGRSLFLVIEGLVDVLAPGPDGQEHRVSTLGPGSYFGEYALLCGERRTATIRTLCESRLFEIDRDALAPILAANAELAASLSEILERRQSRTREALAAHRGGGNGTAQSDRPESKRDLVATIQKLFGLS